mmetsp:Transcript_147950/g.273004  ORF Transcript_147950/g.273004 Transcript_147950/m.273004 type:complete len:94 (-) Transcript_147950:67-348(-)
MSNKESADESPMSMPMGSNSISNGPPAPTNAGKATKHEEIKDSLRRRWLKGMLHNGLDTVAHLEQNRCIRNRLLYFERTGNFVRLSGRRVIGA